VRSPRASVFTVREGFVGSLLGHLCERFPQVEREVWIDRFHRGLIRDESDLALELESLCRAGQRVFYFREVEQEAAPRELERILHQDEYMLVVDKPPFMAVTPSGPHLHQSLLYRLRESTGLEDLSPAHRLDFETSGLMVFATNPSARAAWANLFEERRMEKSYLAVARLIETPKDQTWVIENRLERGEPWFRTRIAQGAPNARSEIQLLEQRSELGLFKIKPSTGKKHQIRVHMATLGFPILNDRYYPKLEAQDSQHPFPLQLLASELNFVHPYTGAAMRFQSTRRLGSWNP
jgi:tRNA pseudouridine32 synthase / 23S rRNA pseudouridine746 synthase